MKFSFLSAFAFLLFAALAGCETTVNLPEPPHTPRVALSFTLTAAPQDSSFQDLYQERQLYVSASQRVFDRTALAGRADATVELRNAAGAVVERYRPVQIGPSGSTGGAGYYRPVLHFQPQPGQAYTLRAAVPGLETAESTLTLPAPAAVESGSYTPRNVSSPNPQEFRGRLNLVVRDDPATANYYLAFAHLLDAQGQPQRGQWSPVEVDYDSQSSSVDIGQFQLSSPQQRYSLYPFADEGGNGQRIVLATDVRFRTTCGGGPNCLPPAYLEVVVSSITPDAYNFYLSRRRYYDSDGNPFAEPAPLASNVRPGYGLFSGATDVTYRIRL